MYYKDLIKELLLSPKKLKTKKPFVRGMEFGYEPEYPENIDIGNKIQAQPPTVRYKIVTQERYMRELDPYCHDVLFDENIPSICVKLKDGGYQEVKQIKTAIPLQRLILDEQVIYLTRNKMLFTLVDTNPTNKQNIPIKTWKTLSVFNFVRHEVSLKTIHLCYFISKFVIII